jgi:adenylyltransferase/sulfurtransferase
MDAPLEVDVVTAARMMQAGALLLDVREPVEVAICAIAGSRHIPMRQVPALASTLPSGQPILVICHLGVRSRSVTHFLRDSGRSDVSNVAGGIDAWAEQVDPTLERY